LRKFLIATKQPLIPKIPPESWDFLKCFSLKNYFLSGLIHPGPSQPLNWRERPRFYNKLGRFLNKYGLFRINSLLSKPKTKGFLLSLALRGFVSNFGSTVRLTKSVVTKEFCLP